MDEREQQRKVRHRLSMLRHAEEVSFNVAATCRYYGISRQAFYEWRRRFEELGEAGLRDNSRRPHHSPNATDTEVVGKIIHPSLLR
jgi:transposase-like protein